MAPSTTKVAAWSEQDVLAFLGNTDAEVARAVASRGLINGRQLEALTSEDDCAGVLGDRSLTRRLLSAAARARAPNNSTSSRQAGEDNFAYKRLEDSYSGDNENNDGNEDGDEAWDPEQGMDEVDPSKHTFPTLFERPSLLTVTLVLLCAGICALCCTVLRDTLADALHVDRKDFVKEFLRYASIPIFMVPFTYVHIWLALYMTFYPTRFRGCCQIPGTNVGFPLGWQGIIPFKVEPMARLAVDQMTANLLDVQEVFDRIDPAVLARELEPELHKHTARVLDLVLAKEAPYAWKLVPQAVRNEVLRQSTKESLQVVEELLQELQADIEDYFDLHKLVVGILVNDVDLFNDLFISCSDRELAFIRNSGAYMGGFFGIGQMILTIVFRGQPWILPVVGLIAGAITNWIALIVIFSPVDPIPLCGGRIVIQGLFLKRQPQVAKLYGHVVRHKILTAENLNRALMRGPKREQVLALSQRHIRAAFDRTVNVVGPLRKLVGDALDRIGDSVAHELSHDMYDIMRSAEPYMNDTFDLQRTLTTRMSKMPPRDFERLLHPIFEQEEWKLVLVGGALGAFFGVFQAKFANM
ncbi:Hypothetical Protein FCC1311_033132 [Hondaea fermentalgiana]|uniref:Uncharacterized protein n=1 Tax=Hondaea fermentalgiana TaxID=2315210 RepID=A0A2R5G7X3_9STRA|nr:Hypothetical Protein FCC1311_033132 [Hondaea fermentalgiana]|eukprot:GBG27090.1 Hypothetical Protein FCC1311_033132 [Hondaea fermentalgiana]